MTQDERLRQQAYQAIEDNKEIVEKDPYRQGYHLMPPVGLLNDPNGWIQWKGIYHMFFQWMPFHTGHGAKFWGHFTSENLVDWHLEPIALTPSDWFDENGCYSGSAISHESKMKIFYTGNVKNEHGERATYQCLAESNDGIHFTKKGVQIHLPKGYTAHFRDPKVWKHGEKWYMVIGAQTEEKLGAAVLYTSEDLKSWMLKGKLHSNEDEAFGKLGYMWECPDLFSLNGKDILLFSPQGLEANGIHYNNSYQTGYFTGRLNYDTASYSHGSFTELDRGFDFYAPQTTEDDKGRRIMIGWMGVPGQNEENQPTIPYKWVHNLTLPRELQLIDDRIYQWPVEELKDLRVEKTYEHTIADNWRGDIERRSEVQLTGHMKKLDLNLLDEVEITFDQEKGLMTVSRPSVVDGKIETRSCYLTEGLSHLRIFLDHSSLEMFVNNGQEVFTMRMFADPASRDLKISLQGSAKVEAWTLKNGCIH
ncbi:glycoside hydrolase family 32 protein [Thalassobacillus pellis]|uniref:glycoside hydrolase family 32 protein n=1 Tax=Thalassobacillus pellis TaxID=748008 RepID=UPI00195F56FD|nr:sucrose-6-phosphate hydrolase [Thalassobacillus pellis]MBM7551472.1 beta-fructofuranosidase [Thalassobacillus pellis]